MEKDLYTSADGIRADIDTAYDIAHDVDAIVADSTNDDWIADVAPKLARLQELIEDAARDTGLTAVEHKMMTRKQAAEILRVHPHTISRWLLARETEQPE